MIKSIKNISNWALQVIDNTIDQAPLDQREKIRLRHFAIFVIMGVLMMVGYGLYNFLIGNFLLGSLVFFCGSSLVFGWLLMCYLPMGQIVYRVNGVLFCGLLLYLLVLGGEEGSKGLWMFAFPLIVFFLTGKKEGLIWSLSALLLGMALLSLPFPGVTPYPYSNSFIIRFATIYLFITIVTFWFELSREHYRGELEAEHLQQRQETLSAHQEVELSLRQAHQQQLTILDSIDAHVYVVDPASYEILYMNHKMKEIFGENLEGRLCWQSFRKAATTCDHCPIPRLLGKNGDTAEMVAWEGFNPISKRWYSNIDRMITWPDQRKVKLQIAFDITGRKQWESERQASEESLHQVEKAEALGRMAGAIAHHFNNQLTVIIGNLQLALEASPGNGPVREYLQNAIRVAIDSSEISMLLFQYLGEHGGELQPFDLAEFCRRQVPSMKMRLLANITIDTDISDTSLTIHADRVMVQQILSQLIANSHEAMNGQGGTILLSVRSVSAMALQGRQLEPKNWRPRQESYCCLEVSDTGCGIDENNRGKIFDPFFTTKLSSRGLGLAIVLGIVKAADGAVEVIGNVPRGCVVRIYLPNFHDTPFGEEK